MNIPKSRFGTKTIFNQFARLKIKECDKFIQSVPPKRIEWEPFLKFGDIDLLRIEVRINEKCTPTVEYWV